MYDALKSKLQKAQEIQNTLAETVVAGVNVGGKAGKEKANKTSKRRAIVPAV